MKKFIFLTIAILLSASPIKAQTTAGTKFWVTFGSISGTSMTPSTVDYFDFRIRVVGGDVPTSGIIYFTNLETSIPFDIDPYEIYTYVLGNTEKYAVYNTSTGITDKSIRITASNPVSVFAFKKYGSTYSDATNILPVTALGTEYYAISRNIYNLDRDAYAVVATQDNTLLYHNETPIPILNAGDVYYRTSDDITGDHITSNNPVAFSAQCKLTAVPGGINDVLFQELAPVNTWGNTFFVPVTAGGNGTEYVRIVVAYNNTDIEQFGGTILTNAGGQPTLTNLQAGQFVDLEISLSNNGCFISASKSVEVCAFMRSQGTSNLSGSCSQVWIPAIDQSISKVLMAPFQHPMYQSHYALIVSSTAMSNTTMVSIGGAMPIPLSNGIWYSHSKGMSFYNFPLTDHAATYTFFNQEGLIVFGYGLGVSGYYGSYYYLAGSAMRDLDAAFYANDIHFQDLKDTAFCAGAVEFRAEIEGELHPDAGSLKWYVDGVEETSAEDLLEWNRYFAAGAYEITMEVHYETGETVSKTATLQIAACNYSAAFYANDVYYADLADMLFCVKDITVTTTIEGVSAMTSLKWYINDVLIPALEGEQTWDHFFGANNYVIKMEITFKNGETQIYEGALSIGSIINIAPITPDGGDTNINGGTPNTGGCFKVGSKIYFNATPK